MAKSIVVDCDGVLIDIGMQWYYWLEDRYEYNTGFCALWKNGLGRGGKLPYDITKLFKIPPDDDAFAFWKSNTLYSGMKPKESSVEVLQQIKEARYEIYVASRVTGSHAKSKCEWVNKYFPFIDGILLTGKRLKEKQYVARNADFFIDDSLNQLNVIEPPTQRIWFRTNYIQEDVESKGVDSDIKHVLNWYQVKDIIFRQG